MIDWTAFIGSILMGGAICFGLLYAFLALFPNNTRKCHHDGFIIMHYTPGKRTRKTCALCRKDI